MPVGEDVGVGPGRVLRAFLLADIRGYSTFAERRGIESTAALAGRFLDLAAKAVAEHDGVVAGTRGDQILAVFESPRDAVSAALAMQRRFVEATRDDPTLPLPVGIGLDVGEAVTLDGEWSATAVNIAARLCERAVGGETLATGGLVDVVAPLDGVRTNPVRGATASGRVALKGISRPVRVVRVSDVDLDVAAELRRLGLARAAGATRRNHRTLLVVCAAAVAAAGAVVAIGPWRSPQPHRVPTALTPNSVGSFAATTGERTADVPLGSAPSAVTFGSGAVWAVSPTRGTATRISGTRPDDPPVSVPVGAQPAAAATGYGAVWVANSSERSVSRVDAAAEPSLADTVRVGDDPVAVATGFGRVWVANELDGTVSVVDPTPSAGGAVDRVVATVPVGSQPVAVTAGPGGVWVALEGTADVVRIDPSSLRVADSVGVGNGPDALAADAGGVWVANGIDGTVSHVDAAHVAVDRTVRVGPSPDALALAGDELWVADRDSDDLRRLDASTGAQRGVVHLEQSPIGLTAGAGRIWVAVGEATSAHRGGTLRVVGSADLHTLDPAHGYSQLAWSVESMVHDGLVTFQRTPGPSGGVVVPDLAARMPRISADRRTYTFRLRRGIHYSNGEPVRASDVRASFERLLRSPDVPPYYSRIVGAAACSPKRCDLSRGVLVDDRSGSVQLRLSTPDPDLLDELAVPFAEILPTGTPDTDLHRSPIPATGPYVIASSTAHTITLARNPRFVPWSDAAQPPGRPDRIVVTEMPTPTLRGADAAARATVAGRFDFSADPVGPALRAVLLKTRTSQLLEYPDGLVRYFFLDTARPPFDDVRVRRAVNFAVDRRAAVRALGGTASGTPTCQILPSSLPGYEPYCPYTADPNRSGAWTAPALGRARALVRRAQAVGAPVRVYVAVGQQAIGLVAVRAMRAVGLHARLTVVPGSRQAYYDYILTAANHVQAGLEGWITDYPSPSNLFGPLLRCAARSRVGNLDESRFCDHRIDAQMDAAAAVQNTDPATSGARWAAVDRAITARAPWVPLIDGIACYAISRRLGNVEDHPEYGLLLDQAWVR